jgi:hypothetical protein
MLANREAVARTMEATVCPIGRPAQAAKRTAILVWVFLGACIVAAGASGMRWASVSRAEKNLTAPPSPAAPPPPDFALEKYEPRSVAGVVRPQPAREVSEDAPESEATASGRRTEATRESSPSPSSVTAGSSAALAAPMAQTPSAASAAAVTGAPPAAATPYRASMQAGAAAFTANAAGLTYLWVGRFQQEEGAQEAAKKIEDLGLPTMVVPRRNPNGEVFVVLSGPYGPKKAPDAMQQLESLGFANIRAIRNLNLPQRTNP